MIHFYTGVPGSGKSLHVAEEIYKTLRKGKNIIANFSINENQIKAKRNKPLGAFIATTNTDLSANPKNYPKGKYIYIDALYNFALMYHKRNKRDQIIEHQTCLVIDECQLLFNSRSWNSSDRLTWIDFFRQHRKFGYDVILVSQDDKSIDKQLRAVLEYQYLHRKINNYKLFGKLLGLVCGGNLFTVTKSWYGMRGKDAKIQTKFFMGKQQFYDFYDSMGRF